MTVEVAGEPSVRVRHLQARLAGLAYLVVVVTGMFSLSYAPSRIFVGATPEALGASVIAHEALLRLAIAAELTCYVSFVVLGLALHRLLEGAGRFPATLMAVLAISSVPFGFANVVSLLEIVRAIDAGSVEQIVGAAYERYRIGLSIQSVPWGLWLIPFGYLVIRSRFLPWPLGVLLILGGVGYVANFGGRLLFEGYEASGLAPLFKAPRIAEILICLWLLIAGARRGILPARSAAR